MVSDSSRSVSNIKRGEFYLNLTVPSLFRCPISMDVMKSPVSLCTGVTYDRTSIQTWLSQGHNTCPATMQVLPSTDFTPNLTLRSLIHHYLHQHPPPADVTSISSPLSSSRSVISRTQAQELVGDLAGAHLLSSPVNSLCKLVDFVQFSEENRKFIANSNDAVTKIVDVLRICEETEACEQIMIFLDCIVLENGINQRLNGKIFNDDFDYLFKFVLILRKGSLKSRVSSVKVLDSIAIGLDSQRKIAENHELLYQLYKLINEEPDRNAVEAGLSVLVSVSTSKMAKKELVRFGMVQTVGRILSISETDRGVIEKAMQILEIIATCTDGRTAISEDGEIITVVVKKLMKCSSVATEHGVTVIWSLCYLARDRTAQEAVIKVNGMAKLLLVMQSNCGAGVRQMCGDLVKVLRVNNSKSCLASYETKTTHIMPY